MPVLDSYRIDYTVRPVGDAALSAPMTISTTVTEYQDADGEIRFRCDEMPEITGEHRHEAGLRFVAEIVGMDLTIDGEA